MRGRESEVRSVSPEVGRRPEVRTRVTPGTVTDKEDRPYKGEYRCTEGGVEEVIVEGYSGCHR